MDLKEKELLINKMLSNKRCIDLRDEIKSYIFIDNVYKKALYRKYRLIKGMNVFLNYWKDPDDDSSWAIIYLYQKCLQSNSCLSCGNYLFVDNYYLYSKRAMCNCHGFEQIENMF
jgi:hypothetical protein